MWQVVKNHAQPCPHNKEQKGKPSVKPANSKTEKKFDETRKGTTENPSHSKLSKPHYELNQEENHNYLEEYQKGMEDLSLPQSHIDDVNVMVDSMISEQNEWDRAHLDFSTSTQQERQRSYEKQIKTNQKSNPSASSAKSYGPRFFDGRGAMRPELLSKTPAPEHLSMTQKASRFIKGVAKGMATEIHDHPYLFFLDLTPAGWLDSTQAVFTGYSLIHQEKINRGMAVIGAIPAIGVGGKVLKRFNIFGKSGKVVGEGVVPNKAHFIDPTEVGFSQTTVLKFKTRTDPITGKTVSYSFDDIVSGMRSRGWQGEPLNVVRMPDGSLTSIDNTRLLAARQAGIKARINVYEYDAPIPLRSAQEYTARGRAVPTSWREAIHSRISIQEGKYFQDRIFAEKFSQGSIYDPKLTGRGPRW